MWLEMIKLKEGAEEPARRQAEAAQAMRAEDYPLVLLRCRRDLPLRRETNPHVVGTWQPPRPAEEVDMVVMDVGAIPGARQHHGDDAVMRKARRRGARDPVAAEQRRAKKIGGKTERRRVAVATERKKKKEEEAE